MLAYIDIFFVYVYDIELENCVAFLRRLQTWPEKI